MTRDVLADTLADLFTHAIATGRYPTEDDMREAVARASSKLTPEERAEYVRQYNQRRNGR